MTEQTARDLIADVLRNHHRNCSNSQSATETEWHINRYVEDTIAIVREALLSDEAVDALLTKTYGWYDYDKGLWYDDAPETEKQEAREEERYAIEHMLDAAFGEEEEG